MDSLQERWRQYNKEKGEQEQQQKDVADANQRLCQIFWNWAQLQPAKQMPLSTYTATPEFRGVKLPMSVVPRKRLHVGHVTKQGRKRTAAPGSVTDSYPALYFTQDGTLTDKNCAEVKFHLLDPLTTFAIIADLCKEHSLTEPAFP